LSAGRTDVTFKELSGQTGKLEMTCIGSG
jgi:hypothetical protein